MEGDNVVFSAGRFQAAPGFAGELYGGFVGFGSRITDEDAGCVVHATRGNGFLDEKFRERARPGVVVKVRGVD